MSNTNTTHDAERVSTVERTRYAARPTDAAGVIVRTRAARFSDAAIVRDAATILRQSIADHGAPMGWVETLRTLRWSGLARCDQSRFRGAHRDGAPNLYADALALAQSRRKIK